LIKLNEGWGNYLEPDYCPEEITYSEWDKDKEYFVIGFDTAHSYNNDSHDEAYITAQANAIKESVDAYTHEDAIQYAKEQIDEVTRKYSKYLTQ
jgi:ATP-dependent Lon protease